jgi:hypothetical protein
MSVRIWVEELNDWVSEEDYQIVKELLEEDNKTRREKRKKELLQKYKDKFSDEIKAKYGIK